MKVMTFSTQFPIKHPRQGEPTYFVEQILNSLLPKEESGMTRFDLIPESISLYINDFAMMDGGKKLHTIRRGKRWKEGDKFSPRIWSGKPYGSKQIEILPEIKITNVLDIEMEVFNGMFSIYINDWPFYHDLSSMVMGRDDLDILAKNDGLTADDFKAWFDMPCDFSGQIICWDPLINY